MGEKYYTGIFEVPSDPSQPFGSGRKLVSLVLVDVHPAVYEACHHTSPALRQYAEVGIAQGEGIVRAYEITGRGDSVITLNGLHDELERIVTINRQRYGNDSRVKEAMTRLEALDAYASATDQNPGPRGPRL